MRKRRFFWNLYQPYILIIIIVLIFFGIYLTNTFKDFYFSHTRQELEKRINLIKDNYVMTEIDSVNLQKLFTEYDKTTDTRVTLIYPDGKVIADSRGDASLMEKHSDRIEIQEALAGHTGYSVRYSTTVKQEMMYIAVPVFTSDKKLRAVLRASIPLENISDEFSNIYFKIIAGGLILFILTMLGGYYITNKFLKPLEDIRIAAKKFSKGDFSQKILPPGFTELKSLSESLNSMAQQLHEKITIISEQKNLQQAVLESMKECVLAVDYEEKILLMNREAELLLKIEASKCIGKTLQEVIRISEIQKFINKILEERKSDEVTIIIQQENEKYLQLNGTVLINNYGEPIGAITVINDVTNLKYIDTLKKDLVANVSHELKTPVTTIKGFIETLKDGAIDDPKNSLKFINIISKHIDRLNLIIDDLLSLSRIEQATAESSQIYFANENIRSIIDSVIEDYHFKIKKNKINIEINCDDNLHAKVNKLLLEQAIGNLIDNAIKYSNKGARIKIDSLIENNILKIIVNDEGYGISIEHFPRLFERFYRIDKHRSRDEGGSGLGLAIVKHIVNAHQGTIEVESELGKGTTFIINIPV